MTIDPAVTARLRTILIQTCSDALTELWTAGPIRSSHEGWKALSELVEAWPEDDNREQTILLARAISATAIRYILCTEGAAHDPV